MLCEVGGPTHRLHVEFATCGSTCTAPTWTEVGVRVLEGSHWVHGGQ